MKTRKVCNRHKATIKHLKSGFKMFSYLNHGLKNEPSAIEHYYHSNTVLVRHLDPHFGVRTKRRTFLMVVHENVRIQIKSKF